MNEYKRDDKFDKSQQDNQSNQGNQQRPQDREPQGEQKGAQQVPSSETEKKQ